MSIECFIGGYASELVDRLTIDLEVSSLYEDEEDKMLTIVIVSVHERLRRCHRQTVE